jgi:hypothetical protein
MTYADLIEYFKSQGAASAALGLSQPSVCEWQHTTIPFSRQCQIQVLTKGGLKANRIHDSRPKRGKARIEHDLRSRGRTTGESRKDESAPNPSGGKEKNHVPR